MKTTTKTTIQLRDQCLSHCANLGIPLEPASLDEVLGRAEKEGFSHLQFLDLLRGAEAGAASLADKTLPVRLRYYANPDLLIID
jgi:hypothetical protein